MSLSGRYPRKWVKPTVLVPAAAAAVVGAGAMVSHANEADEYFHDVVIKDDPDMTRAHEEIRDTCAEYGFNAHEITDGEWVTRTVFTLDGGTTNARYYEGTVRCYNQ